MSEIERSGTTRRWSDTASWQGLLFLCEVPGQVDAGIAAQTRDVLATLEQRLQAGGSSRQRILNATIYLPEREDLAEFNAIWDEWIPAGHAPVRACVHAALTDPRMRVEIQLIAATA